VYLPFTLLSRIKSIPKFTHEQFPSLAKSLPFEHITFHHTLLDALFLRLHCFEINLGTLLKHQSIT